MKPERIAEQTAEVLSVLGNPFRLQLIQTIGTGEACVCHLEDLLGKRQAFISQHLMALRKAGILETRREGKFIFYRLASDDIAALLESAASLAGLDADEFPPLGAPVLSETCCCPHCSEEDTNP
jgi:ArsR family transcriptional regulator